MADDDTQPATPAQADDSDAAGNNDPKPGVSIPSWMAGALVVVLALAIGLAGFAIGRVTADDGGRREFQPIGAQAPGGGGPGSDELPFPGGPGGPGGERGPGGPGGQRGERGEQREGDEGQQDDGDQSEDEEPELDQDQGEGL